MAALPPEQQTSKESNSTRNRSFGGCATCRSRHVKCDEGRPTCSMCRYFGLACGGYEKSIFFDFESNNATTDDGTVRFRRPLLTEGERERMSEWLTSAVPPKTALRVLAQIDDECENSTFASQDIQISRGPFGAFRLGRDQPIQTCDPLSDESEYSSPPQDLVHTSHDCLVSLDAATLSPWTQELIQSIFEQSEQIPHSPLPNFLDMTMDSARFQEVFDGNPIPELPEFSITPRTPSGYYQCPQFILGAPFNQSLPAPASFSSVASATNNAVPQDAVLLLKHYAATVIRSLTPFQHSKSPWDVLFLPHARNCLAALTLGEQLDDASLSAFYGILAISAFSLSGISQSPMWAEQGRAYKQQAREHTRLMLHTAYDVPKTAKYKSTLMALVTMVQVSIFAGNRDQTECYLLEAEKFIRLKGLKRKKSRKVRLLHHCYAFMRIFHESTFMCGVNASQQRHHVREAVESSGLVIYGQDSLSFRLIGWNSSKLDEEMMAVKGQEEGENDLHLERPGLFPATLYPEIYGVPEEWMQLLSQVIRLGNEKDAVDEEQQQQQQQQQKNATMGALNLKDFVSRAKAIERCITQLRQPSQNTTTTTATATGRLSPHRQRQIDQYVLENMLDAMRSALAIYFYRRIYDVDASMLQPQVVHVRDCLVRCDEHAVPRAVSVSAGFMWTAFIAACEAEDAAVQASFATWFTHAAERSGLAYFTHTLDNIEHVWQEKRRGAARGCNVTWLDLMKNNAVLQGLRQQNLHR